MAMQQIGRDAKQPRCRAPLLSPKPLTPLERDRERLVYDFFGILAARTQPEDYWCCGREADL